MAHRIYDWRLLRTGKYACLQPMPVGMKAFNLLFGQISPVALFEHTHFYSADLGAFESCNLKPDSLAHSSDFTVLTLVKNHFKNYSALLLVNYMDICRSGFSAVKLNACFKLYKLILVN